jgi:glycerophosphoryl diester phosphodiesterase
MTTSIRSFLLLLALAIALPALAFDLQAHRGGRGLMPENSLPAFENALAIGVDTLELDVGVTADGVVVISHDPYLNPLIVRDAGGQFLTGARGPLLRSLTYAQLQAYQLGRIQPGTPYATTFATQQGRDGVRFPTLASLFERVKALGANDVRFNIETKLDPGKPEDTVSPEAMTRALLKVIDDAGMAPRVTIQSFDWRSLQLVQQLAPRIPTVYLTIQTANTDNVRDGWTAGFRLADHGSVPKMVKAAGGAVWSPNGGAVTEALVKEAQALGLKVVPWTINAPADLDRFLGWGVDGLITDYPDRLREAMARRGMALPKPVALK